MTTFIKPGLLRRKDVVISIITSSCYIRPCSKGVNNFKRFSTSSSSTSSSSRSKKLSVEEVTEKMRQANEKMRQYHINRPPIHVLQKSKLRNSRGDQHLYIQLAAVSTLLTAFLLTPFIGRKIARDEDFRKKYIPSWYDFTLEKPDYAWTRKELHEQLVELQKELHEKAIKGEFTPEKIDEMRRHFAGAEPENDPHGWGKIHPGLDDDEDIEDD